MPKLVWDKLGDRVYESGLDRGVLYLPDGSAVPWNGLTAVIEHYNQELSPVYYEGMKVADLVVLGDFTATVNAITYPDEFMELEGSVAIRRGTLFGNQEPQVFGLCYRSDVGNDLEGQSAAHKIHILYNVTAVPKDRSYSTRSDSPEPMAFEWEISALPEEVPGFSPTAHIVLDSREIDPWLLEEFEVMLYGSRTESARLIPMPELISYVIDWYRIKVVDHGDGTWSATVRRPELLDVDSNEQLFTLFQANAIFLRDGETFVLKDTHDLFDVPSLRIDDHADGTWSATAAQSGQIVMLGDGMFEILSVDAEFLDDQTYRVSDTH